MKTMIKRIRRLESLSSVAVDGRPRETLRVLVQYVGEPAPLETATCHRRIDRNGLLMEVVYVDGSSAGLTDENLDHFLENFPVEAPGPVCTGGRRTCHEDGGQKAAQAGGSICVDP
jgi:hypothetical protein